MKHGGTLVIDFLNASQVRRDLVAYDERVDAPGIRAALHRAHAADTIDHEDGSGVGHELAHRPNVVPGAVVYGSPAMSQPPMHPSNSPNGLALVDAPRRAESYGQTSMAESVVLSHGAPASSTVTLRPARVRT